MNVSFKILNMKSACKHRNYGFIDNLIKPILNKKQ